MRNSVLFANLATATAEEELSEEDQQLKGELDMIVERLTVRIYHIRSISKRQLTVVRNQTTSSTKLRLRP